MKKFTKILSLALALALVLGMTAMADPSEVYLYEEFDYDSTTAFDSDYHWIIAGLKDNENYSTESGSEKRYTADEINTFRTNGKTKLHYFTTKSRYNNRGLNGGYSIQDVDGDKAFQYGTTTRTRYDDRSVITFIPEKVWAPTAETNEAYVISMDFKNIDYADGVAIPAVTKGTYETDGSTTTYYDSEGEDITDSLTTAISKVNAVNEGGVAQLFSTTASANLWNLRNGITLTKTATDETTGDFELSGFGGMRYENDSSDKYVLEKDVRYNFKNVLTYDDGTKFNLAQYVDGVFKRSGSLNVTDVSAYRLQPKSILAYQLYNVKMYSLSTADNAFNVSTGNATNLPTNTASMTVKFSQPVEAATYHANAVTMTEDGEAFTGFTAGNVVEKIVGNEIYSEVVVTFNRELNYGKTYEIVFPATVKNTIAAELGGTNNKVTFTTEKAATFEFINFKANEGLVTGTELEADAIGGKTVFFTVTAKNVTGRAIDGVLAIGIFDAENNLVKYAYANKSFADDDTNDFSAAFKVAEGQTAKAFVKDTASIKVFGE